MLLVNDTPYKSLFNEPFNAIFLEYFDSFHKEDNYLLGIVFPYLETFHCSKYGVIIFVEENIFGCIKNNSRNKMLFVKGIGRCDASYCKNEKMKMKKKTNFF
jgi:hypothetical protein